MGAWAKGGGSVRCHMGKLYGRSILACINKKILVLPRIFLLEGEDMKKPRQAGQ